MIPLVSSRGKWVFLSRKLSNWDAAGLELDLYTQDIPYLCSSLPPNAICSIPVLELGVTTYFWRSEDT
jgi:hypothetical protein